MSQYMPQMPQQMPMQGYPMQGMPQMQQPQMFQPQQGVPTTDRINQLGAQMAALDEQYKQLKQQTYSAQPALQQTFQQTQPAASPGFLEVAVTSYEQAREFTIAPENLNNRYILTDTANKKMYIKYFNPDENPSGAVFREYQLVEQAAQPTETPTEQPEKPDELQPLKDQIKAVEDENKGLKDSVSALSDKNASLEQKLKALEEKINDSRIRPSNEQPNGSDADGKQPAVKPNSPKRKPDGDAKSVA